LKTHYLTSEAERKYRKKYYERNKEKLLAAHKERYKQNREELLAYNKQYNMTHDRSEYFKEYYRRKKERSAV